MVRFSCFNAHAHSSKPKKTLQPSFEAYQTTLPDSSCGYFPDGLPMKSVTPLLNSQGGTEATNSIKLVSSPERSLKSEDTKSMLYTMEREMVRGKSQLKKSQSLGSGLYQEGRVSEDNDVKDEIGQGYSCDGFNDQNAPISETFHHGTREIVNNDTIFSIEDHRSRSHSQSHSENDQRASSDSPELGERAFASGLSERNIFTPRGITKSCSLPNFGDAVSTPLSERCADLGQRSRSFQDLRVSVCEADKGSVQGRAEDANDERKAERATFENVGDDNYDSGDYSCLAKDWVVPVQEKVDNGKKVLEEHSLRQWVELPNRDFKIKRIEEWVNDLKHCRELEETDEPPVDCSNEDRAMGSSSVSAVAKLEDKVSPSVGMEASKRYISSLSAAATNAHLANHGLVVIPFLSAFGCLKVLNLSGNSIVKITSGALPRGLHTLNLSKNSIATIEGLRELTRLRVLDLSYNRILRIGHGLASCSGLKELYIAGNKISEVEGLHRLLKLTVLDMRFNKISTAKCLGQLAANYNSLQAISLEGNPAQKNVGDDHLKKHLQGLLPHLSYFNRQPTKAGALKDSADRSVRLGMSSHQLDRGLRKPAASSKHSKGRRLPPPGNKLNRNTHYPEFGSRILNLRHELSTMRRSRSEGTLGGGAL